ncbi:MAG TPA: MarR family transcriptional regulator [Actinomycetota bacterium]|nr:MarR family transcriptional regulator [Actinomycetota bacterium]
MPSARLTAAELRAWQALLHAHHQITTALDRDLRMQHDLSFSEYDVLLRLARNPGRALRMTQLAERVLLSPSGLTRLVDRLAAKGLVSRQRDSADARGALARLTADGMATLRQAARTHVQGIREQFTGRLSDVQLRNVASGLETIVGPHEAH